MAKHKVEISNVDTSKLKVISQEEMNQLFIKYKEGDKFAKNDLVEGNLRLVLAILKKYNNRCDNMDDLFQVGCIGLIKAINNFNINLGIMFSTYAVPMIIGEVRRYLRDNNAIRVSRSIKDLAYKALHAKEELTNELGYTPSTKEIADHLNISEIEIVNAIDSMKEPMSIFEPIYNDGGDTIYLYEQLEDKKKDQDVESLMALKKAIKDLSTREQMILDERFVIGKTQSEIAQVLGISQAQVSRLEHNAILTLKRVLK